MRPQTICWCGKSRRHVLTATVVLLHFMFAAHVLAGPVFLHMRASSIRQAFDSKIDVNIVSENLLRQNLRGETMVLAKADNNDIYLSGITANGAVQLIRLGSNGSIAWSTTFGIESLSNQVNAIVADSSGSVYIAGRLEKGLSSAKKGGAMVAKYSADGKQEWVSIQGSSSYKDTFNAIVLIAKEDTVLAAGFFGSKTSFLSGGGYVKRPIVSAVIASTGRVDSSEKPSPISGTSNEEITSLSLDAFNAQNIVAGGSSGNAGVIYNFSVKDGNKIELTNRIKLGSEAVVDVLSPANRQGTYYALGACTLHRIDGSPTVSSLKLSNSKNCLGAAKGIVHRGKDDTLVVLVEGSSKIYALLYSAANGELMAIVQSNSNIAGKLNGPILYDDLAVLFAGVQPQSESKAFLGGTIPQADANSTNTDTQQGFVQTSSAAGDLGKNRGTGAFSDSGSIVKLVAIGGSALVLALATAAIVGIVWYTKRTGPPA